MKTTTGSEVSRRSMLGLAAAALAALLPISAAAQQKIAQKMVQYQDKPKGPQECDNCLQFIAPHGCKLVDGTINPKGWCQLYAAKPK